MSGEHDDAPRGSCEFCAREIIAGVILVMEVSACEAHGLVKNTRMFCNHQCALHSLYRIVRAQRRQLHERARELAALERMAQEPLR